VYKNNTTLKQGLISQICANKGLVSRLEPHVWSDPLHPHEGCVNTVQWNPSGTLLVSGGDDVKLNIWNVEKQRVIVSIPTSHSGNIFCCKFLPETNDSRLVSCAADGILNVYDVNYAQSSYTAIHRFNNHSEMTHKLALEPHNPNIIISSSQDGTCRQFDLREATTRNCSSILVDWSHLESPGHRGHSKAVAIHSVDLNPVNTNFMIVGGGDYFIRLYDRRMNQPNSPSLKCLKVFAPQRLIEKNERLEEQNRFFMPTHITGVRYNYSGTEIIGTFSGDSIYMFDVEAEGTKDAQSDEIVVNEYVQSYSGHRNTRTVKEVNFLGPRHEYILSGSDDGNVFIWEKDSGQIVHCAKGDKHVVNCLDLHPVYPLMFASSGIDYDIKIWEPTALEARSTEMNKIDEIKERNEQEAESSQSSLLLPSSFVLRLMNLMNGMEEDESDEGTPTTGGEASEERNRSFNQLLSRIAFVQEEDEEEEEEEEETGQRGTQCRTQ